MASRPTIHSPEGENKNEENPPNLVISDSTALDQHNTGKRRHGCTTATTTATTNTTQRVR
jgi:hypothetical protein